MTGRGGVHIVLFLLVAVQASIWTTAYKSPPQATTTRTVLTFEFLSDVCHLLIDPLLLQLPHARTADIRDELDTTRMKKAMNRSPENQGGRW